MKHLREKIYHWLTGYLDSETTQSNAAYSIVDGMAYSIMIGLTSSFMAVFAIKLGATDQMLGILSSGPALIGLLSQIPSAIVTERTDKKLQPILAWGFVHRINYLFFAIIPFLPILGIYKAWLFIILVTWMNFPAVVVNTMWTHLMGEIFPISSRGRVFGDRNFIVGWVTIAAMLLAGPLLDLIPYPYNYGILFGLSFAGLMVSLYYLKLLKEERVETTSVSNVSHAGPFDGMFNVIKDRQFLNFTAASFVYYMGFNVAASMWTILYVRFLFLNNTQIAMIAIVSTVISTISYRFWGRVSDRIGSKQVYFIGCLLFLTQPYFHSFITVKTAWMLWPLAIANGLAGGAFNLAQFNTLLSIAPDPAKRPSYIAFYNMAMQITGFIFPMLGIWLYQNMGNQLNPVFYLSTFFRCIGLIYLAAVIKVKLPFHPKRKNKHTISSSSMGK